MLIFRPETIEFVLDKAVATTRLYSVSPGYLNAAGTRLLAGRDFAWHDGASTPLVALVNETFARKLWPDSQAVGQRFIVSGRMREVIGVIEDGKYHDLMESPQPVVFLPLSQAPQSDVVLVVRSRLAANQVGPTLARTLSRVEPDIPMNVQSWPDALRGVLFPFRAATLALSVMAVLAGMLAVSGIFGMTAYSVSRRLREFGIRVALGAKPQQVITAAVERPAILLGIGSAAGLLMTMVAVRLLSRIVYHPEPASPTVIVVVTFTMAAIGMAGVAIPVRRALAISPSDLMREE